MIKSFLAALLIVLLCCCKKPDTILPETPVMANTELTAGVPPNVKEINAYLYACNYTLTQGYVGFPTFKRLVCFAAFSDPKKRLTKAFNRYYDFLIGGPEQGNVSVGELRINNVPLNPGSNSVSHNYNLTLQNTLNTPITWTSEGNKAFKAIDLQLSGFPQINFKDTFTTLHRNRDTIIDMEKIFSNYDTIYVELNISSGTTLTKKIAYPESKIILKRLEFGSSGSQNYPQIKYAAFKFYHQIINDKQYLFEFSTKRLMPLYWKY